MAILAILLYLVWTIAFPLALRDQPRSIFTYSFKDFSRVLFCIIDTYSTSHPNSLDSAPSRANPICILPIAASTYWLGLTAHLCIVVPFPLPRDPALSWPGYIVGWTW
jgi:hypothetical protein